MDEKETMLIIIKAINTFCKTSGNCNKCPFHLKSHNSSNRFCMFADVVFPEDWDISQLEEELDQKEGE